MSNNIITKALTNKIVFAKQDWIDHVSEHWFNADFWLQKQAIIGESKGRNTTYFIDINKVVPSGSDIEGVLRHYYRGGLIGKVNKDKYVFTGLNNTRAYREFELLTEMSEQQLPVPEPIAAMVIKRGLFYQNAMIIKRISQSQDVFHILKQRPLSESEWQRLGKMIKQFHNHNVHHTDMNIHNILMDESGKSWLIDFDKCYFDDSKSDWKTKTLNRLHRSLNKELNLHPHFQFNEQNWQWFLTGYQQ